MKKIIIASFVNLMALTALAAPGVNQSVADAVNANAEIQAVVKSITENRGIECKVPAAEQTSVVKLSSDEIKFSAVYRCNEYDQNGQPQANVQTITIKGIAYEAAPGKVGIVFQGLDIAELE